MIRKYWVKRLVIGVAVITSTHGVYAGPRSDEIDAGTIRYFSSSYQEARRKFLDAAEAAGAQIESLEIASSAPLEERLFTDIAWIGRRDSKTVLVAISGTHGVEGFAGSAVQTGVMTNGIASSLKKDFAVLMVHALNPHGFQHHRRFNEDNVDVNRNFLDHTELHPKNPGYDSLVAFISPESLSTLSKIFLWPRLLWYKAMGRTSELQQAISGGQYSHPEGLFYGGTSESWSNMTIQRIAADYLAGADRVIVLDFHTGLGAYGEYEIILQQSEESDIYRRAVSIWGEEHVRTTFDVGKSSDASSSVRLTGPLKLAIPFWLPNAEVTAVTMEYGTVSLIKAFLALREENWLVQHGDPSSGRGNRIKSRLREAFYPSDDQWQQQVWSAGERVLHEAMAYAE